MITLYKSEKTGKIYESEEELTKAEEAYDAKYAEINKMKAERAEAAKLVEELEKKAEEARKAADKALRDFCAKYGTYHKTITSPGASTASFLEFISDFPYWF